MNDFHVGFAVTKDEKESLVILRFKELSVDRVLEILSPQFGLYDESMSLKDYVGLVKLATQGMNGEGVFVWLDNDGISAQPLDYAEVFGRENIFKFAGVLTGFIITGKVLDNPGLIYTGSVADIKKKYGKGELSTGNKQD